MMNNNTNNNNTNQQHNNNQHEEIKPSAVLHIRALPPQTKEADLYQLLGELKFGRCTQVRLLEKHQALAEMDTIEAATRVYLHSQQQQNTTSNNSGTTSGTGQLTLYSRPIQISYSRSKTINQQQQIAQVSSNGNVLLCTIENPGMNQITVDHLHIIFAKYGEVLRIVIFNKASLQALIEFSSPESANNARKHLNNVSICQNSTCTLRIEISKTNKLNVVHNTEKTKDFTKPLPSILPPYFQQNFNSPQLQQQLQGYHNNQQQQQPQPQQQQPQHHSPQQSINQHHSSHVHTSPPNHHHQHNNMNNSNTNNIIHHNQHHSSHVHTSPSNGNHSHHSHHSHHHSNNNHHHFQQQNILSNNGIGGGGGNQIIRTSVILVHGLEENIMTADKIFNLFSVYGNVQKVKVLTTKKGAAMVQMEDAQQAETVIRYYHQLTLFGEVLQIHYSKHQTITDSHNPESGSTSIQLNKDFTNSSLNRFTHTPINNYKHLYKPSSTLYFSNVPKEFNDQSFYQLFTSLNAPKPIAIKTFSLAPLTPTTPTTTTTTTSSNGTSSTSSTTSTAPTTSSTTTSSFESKHSDKIVGLLEFSSLSNALEALVLANNHAPQNSHPIRLSFSNSSVLPHAPRSSTNATSTSTNQSSNSNTTPTQSNIMNNTTSPNNIQKSHH